MDFRLTIPGKDELWELPHDRRWQVRRGGQVAGFRRGTQGRWCCTGRCTEFGTDRDGRCSDFLRSRSSGSPTFQGFRARLPRTNSMVAIDSRPQCSPHPGDLQRRPAPPTDQWGPCRADLSAPTHPHPTAGPGPPTHPSKHLHLNPKVGAISTSRSAERQLN